MNKLVDVATLTLALVLFVLCADCSSKRIAAPRPTATPVLIPYEAPDTTLSGPPEQPNPKLDDPLTLPQFKI